MENNNMNNPVPTQYPTPGLNPNIDPPGKGLAIASLVLGIITLLFIFFFPIGGLVTGIIGIVCASKAKSAGNSSGMQTAGFVCSLVGLVINAFIFVACVACAGVLGTTAGSLRPH